MLEQQTNRYYENRYKFTGKELDEKTGLYDFGARHYNPSWGVWLSVDPMAQKMPKWSSYNYTFGNPIRYVDPDGRVAVQPGDYYDRKGKYLGTDGIDDGKIYLLNKGKRPKLENKAVNWGGL